MTFLAAQTSFAGIHIDIPEPVLTTFQALYPKAEEVNWDEYDGEYYVSFENGEYSSMATFNAKGTWIETTTSLTEEQLPESISNYVTDNHGEELEYYDGMSLIERPDFVRYYISIVTDTQYLTLTFSEGGELLKKEVEKS